MAVKILWYLTEPYGTIPWTDEGRWDTDFKHLQQLAGAIDNWVTTGRFWRGQPCMWRQLLSLLPSA